LNFAEATLSLDHLHVRHNDFEYGRALAASFVAEKNCPTAFVALNDEVAIGAMHGFQAAGLRVPQDVSIAGFNNQEICLMPTPMLTSVDQQVQLTTNTAVDLLLARIGHPRHAHPLVQMISPVLVTRDSTGPASRAHR
jgi:DNA-binding LacI/PurR family transcriptional regulator